MSDNHTTVVPAAGRLTVPDPGPADAPLAPVPTPPAPARTRRPAPRLLQSPSSMVWAGLGVVAAGFLVIAFSWVKVAATLDVGRQMPYVVSGAMTGLGLIVVGIAVVDMSVRRQDRMERRHQLALMRTVLEELREVLDDDRDVPDLPDRPRDRA